MKIKKAKSIYVILNPENNRVKVGISDDVDRRLISLENGSGCRLKLLYKSKPILMAEQAEQDCHKILEKHQYYKEWFSVSQDLAINCVKRIEVKYPLDELVDDYLNKGFGVNELADKFDVTRQGVVKKLKQYGIYGVTFTDESEIGQELENGIEVDITRFKRIGRDLYMRYGSDEVMIIKWMSGKFIGYPDIKFV